MPSVLVATLGAEPQIVPLALAALAGQGAPVEKVVVLLCPAHLVWHCSSDAALRCLRRTTAGGDDEETVVSNPPAPALAAPLSASEMRVALGSSWTWEMSGNCRYGS